MQSRDVDGQSLGHPVERGFEWLYARYKSRYVHVLLTMTCVGVITFNAPMHVVLTTPLIRGRSWEPGFTAVFLSLAAVVVWPCVFVPTLIRHRAPLRWLRGGAEDPGEVWTTTVNRTPGTTAWILASLTVAIVVPVATYLNSGLGLDPVETTVTAIALILAFLGSGIFYLLVFEVALRPMVADITSMLPDDFAAPQTWLLLRRKLLLVTAGITIFAGVSVGGLTAGAGTHVERTIVATVASVGLAITLAGVLLVLLRYTIFSRMDRLSAALAAVRCGRRDLHLPPISGDELDAVAWEFNQMVERLAQSELEMRESRARLVAVADAERRRMERDLHDGAQQHLALLNLQLLEVEYLADEGSPVADAVGRLRASLTEAGRELRKLAHGIYPSSLVDDGLAAALAEAARRATIPTVVEVDRIGRLDTDAEAAVYFCCLEALQNSGKHAGDGAVAVVRLTQRHGRLEFSVSDDGCGFDTPVHRHGLVNMRDRIVALDGELTIESVRDCGTRVVGWVPVRTVEEVPTVVVDVEEEPAMQRVAEVYPGTGSASPRRNCSSCSRA